MPRGLGGKGRGRGGTQTRPVAAIPVAVGGDRRVVLEVRKAGLMKKAKELAETADAPVVVLCSGLDGQGALQCWPSTETARAVVGRFLQLPKEARIVFDHANYAVSARDVQGSRLARVREGGLAAALGLWEESPLDGMSEDALRELLASIGKSLDATRGRIRSVAENFAVTGEGHASGEVQGTRRQPRRAVTAHDAARKKQLVAGEGHASGDVQGTRRQPRGATTAHDDPRKQVVKDPKVEPAAADGAPWRKQLVEDLKEKPVPAAPFDPGMIEHINVGGYVMERGAYDFIQYDLGMPPPSGEMPVVWRQPRGAATDDAAARMKQLVEDPKGKTAAADAAAARMKQPVEKPVPAAPFDPGMIEHINVGGYVMERGAYDFIRYDLGMLPPSLEPEPPEPDYDEPLRLWSWDDFSFPQSAPPPK